MFSVNCLKLFLKRLLPEDYLNLKRLHVSSDLFFISSNMLEGMKMSSNYIKSNFSLSFLYFMPLCYRSARIIHHFCPVMQRRTCRSITQSNLTNRFILCNPVIIHDNEIKAGVAKFFHRDVKNKGFVPYRISDSFLDRRLLLFDTFPSLHTVDFYVRI